MLEPSRIRTGGFTKPAPDGDEQFCGAHAVLEWPPVPTFPVRQPHRALIPAEERIPRHVPQLELGPHFTQILCRYLQQLEGKTRDTAKS
jgi:hypothetical protein